MFKKSDVYTIIKRDEGDNNSDYQENGIFPD